MKIVQSIEATYQEQWIINNLLKKKVDDVFLRIKSDSWHYFSRLKELQSFALKLETGRFLEPQKLEDFFACTIVVENLDQINKATTLIRRNFNIRSQKPKNIRHTHKDPSSFQFDDLRLFGTLIQPEFLPEEPINSIVFEIQIKTFLQHAWSLATHDLIYKSEEINWSKERIAYQIKAMLEQAEVTISGVNSLIGLPEVLKDSHETTQQKKILRFYKDLFNREDLPKDLVRLCKNTIELLKILGVNLGQLRAYLRKENNFGRGTNLKNLSPFLIILQAIINQNPSLVQDFIDSNDEQKVKIIIPKEIDASLLLISNAKNIIRI